MGAVTATILAGAGLAASGIGMAQSYQSGEANVALAELSGKAQKAAFDSQADMLAEDQRKQRGATKVALATSGSYGQEQPLMLMAEQLNRMEQDLVETRLRGRFAEMSGRSEGLLYRLRSRERTLRYGASVLNQSIEFGKALNGLREQ